MELHNTLYAAGGNGVDALADAAPGGCLDRRDRRAPAARRLPGGHRRRHRRELDRAQARPCAAALAAAVEGRAARAGALAAINAASARAPWSPVVRRRAGEARSTRASDFHGATCAEVDARGVRPRCDRASSPDRSASELRLCGAPGCVLLFVRDHPRREWCSQRLRQPRSAGAPLRARPGRLIAPRGDDPGASCSGICSRGSPAGRRATCPGGGRATRTRSSSARSCCSRRRSRA